MSASLPPPPPPPSPPPRFSPSRSGFLRWYRHLSPLGQKAPGSLKPRRGLYKPGCSGTGGGGPGLAQPPPGPGSRWEEEVGGAGSGTPPPPPRPNKYTAGRGVKWVHCPPCCGEGSGGVVTAGRPRPERREEAGAGPHGFPSLPRVEAGCVRPFPPQAPRHGGGKPKRLPPPPPYFRSPNFCWAPSRSRAPPPGKGDREHPPPRVGGVVPG